jgi:hypothetical protein
MISFPRQRAGENVICEYVSSRFSGIANYGLTIMTTVVQVSREDVERLCKDLTRALLQWYGILLCFPLVKVKDPERVTSLPQMACV